MIFETSEIGGTIVESERTHHLVINLEDTVIFPRTATRVQLDTETGQRIEGRKENGNNFAIALTEIPGHHGEGPDALYHAGNLISIDDLRRADGGYVAKIRTLTKVRAVDFQTAGGILFAVGEPIEDRDDLDEKSRNEMLSYIRETVEEIGKNFEGARPMIKQLMELGSIDAIIANAMPFIAIPVSEKQEMMELESLRERSLRFIDVLLKQKGSISMRVEMARRFSDRTNKNYREAMLREQMKAIQEELGEISGKTSGEADYKAKIAQSDMPDDVRTVALEEADRLEAMGKNNPESAMVRNYLDLLVALPWKTKPAEEIDIEKAREVLESNHYGLDEVKDRIIQHLAVMKLKKDKQGSILLLVGPPGTGKTSLGRSIAETLGRKYVRMSLGGIRDEAEIRGHRRTYIGALPGRIIQGMKRAGEKNPVFVLDEVDKISASFAGDPASALLEVLDPEQNSTFADHYLEVPYDLSDVLFIGTANSLQGIPAPLIDRAEVIQVSGYTNPEKLRIGIKHLFPKVLEEHGLDDSRLRIDEDAMKVVIEKYTREAGVRGLTQLLAKLVRVTSTEIVAQHSEQIRIITADQVEELLGRPKVRLDDIQKESVPGVVTGLAWTPVGGDILFVEGTLMPGKGGLTLTGQLGDVMKESATISMSLVRSRLAHAVTHFDYSQSDIHVHVPAGATPKDGPSAGVTMFTALASLLLGKPIDRATAMTGEVTLRGSVLPVGGIKEKVIAAHRAGVKRVLLPAENRKDLEDVPEDVRADLSFTFVDTVEEILKETLDVDLPAYEWIVSDLAEGVAAGRN